MKISAMFLPQFHADASNSRWWGEGFTEWNNVRSATPLFQGHYQPRVPRDGYFDLSDAEELVAQAKLARVFGVDAFTIYDYWYEGHRLLSRPLEILLENPEVDIAFSLCWANHSWTRSWTNRTGALDVLIEQRYAADREGREAHFLHLVRAFTDSRYIRIDGKPLLQIYNAAGVPAQYIDDMRQRVEALVGAPPHIDALLTSWSSDWSFLDRYDSATLFQPSAALFSPLDMFCDFKAPVSISTRLRAAPLWLRRLAYLVMDRMPDRFATFDFTSVWDRLCEQYKCSARSSPLPLNPMAFVDFDNTARYRERAKIMTNHDIGIFRDGLARLSTAAAETRNIGYIFVNAWNEWGEAAYLQPDMANGLERLEAIRDFRHEAA